MKFVDEFRDPAAARALVKSITELAGDDEFKFMEVCGGRIAEFVDEFHVKPLKRFRNR